jgi:hypothetical protein
MERKQQAERVQRLIDAIARKAMVLPPDARLAYIKQEVAKVRADFRRTYEADPRLAASAMLLVDPMYSAVKARVSFLERNAGNAGAS